MKLLFYFLSLKNQQHINFVHIPLTRVSKQDKCQTVTLVSHICILIPVLCALTIKLNVIQWCSGHWNKK